MFLFYLIAVLLYYVIDSKTVRWILTVIFPSISLVGGFEALYFKGIEDAECSTIC